MKRSAMLRKITHLLKTWDGSELNGETSKEILDLIEDNGMLPPPTMCRVYDDIINEWEPENEYV